VLDDLEEKYVYQDVARESRRPSEQEAMARRRRSPPLRGSWESGLVCGILCNGISGKYREVGSWGRVPFSKKLMSPTPRRKWYLTTGRRAH